MAKKEVAEKVQKATAVKKKPVVTEKKPVAKVSKNQKPAAPVQAKQVKKPVEKMAVKKINKIPSTSDLITQMQDSIAKVMS